MFIFHYLLIAQIGENMLVGFKMAIAQIINISFQEIR